VRVTVTLAQSENVRAVNIRPQLTGEPPDGYFVTSINYSPQSIFVSLVGGAESLPDGAAIPDSLFTFPIDLTNRTESFEIVVPLELDSGTSLLSPISETDVTVSIGISVQTGTSQFDAVPLVIAGARPGYRYSVEPDEVSLLVTGPQPLLEELTLDSLRATVDVTAFENGGTYRAVPEAFIAQGDTSISVQVLPAEVTLEVMAPDAPTATAARTTAAMTATTAATRLATRTPTRTPTLP
jgi:YbbR domain-containing protein